MKKIEYNYFCTKEKFINSCIEANKKYNDKYIIHVVNDNEIRFGVERAGHSGGYWYIATLEENEKNLHIHGEIIYTTNFNGSPHEYTKKEKIKDKLFEIVIFILLWWLILALYIGRLIYRLYKKIRKQDFKKLSNEEKLDNLMINLLCCEKIQTHANF